MAGRLLPLLVGAMSFLGALAIAGNLAAASLAAQWNQNTGAALTIQVPGPGDPAPGDPAPGGPAPGGPGAGGPAAGSRLQAVLAVLNASPGVSAVRTLSNAEITGLLQPWLGADAASLALPLPAVITALWSGAGAPERLRAALAKAAPGTLTETGADWAAHVAALTESLQTCAAAILLIVALVAAAVISVATHAGLAQRRETIEIIHGLGALDSDIAGRFARRATFLAALGAAIGTACAAPVLFWLAALAAPFAGTARHSGLPPALWFILPLLPAAAAAIGWLTTQLTVRGWLRRLV